MMILIFGCIGSLAGSGLITFVNSSKHVQEDTVYYFIGSLNIIIGIITSYWMKDIIRSVDFI